MNGHIQSWNAMMAMRAYFHFDIGWISMAVLPFLRLRLQLQLGLCVAVVVIIGGAGDRIAVGIILMRRNWF